MRHILYPKPRKLKTHDTVRINYEYTKGKPGKPVLFFVHGLGGDLSAWDEERLIFAQLGYPTLAMDLRGHGYSDRPKAKEAYTLPKFAADLQAVLDKEKIKKCVLIGHCFGGVVTIVFASLFPESLLGLILIDTTYKSALPSPLQPGRELIAALLPTLAKIAPTSHMEGYKDLMKLGYAENWDLKGALTNALHTSLYSWMMGFENLVNLDLSTVLRTLRVPTLVITGTDDTVFPPHIAKEIHHLLQKSQFASIPLANHVLVINNPAEVSACMNSFLATLPRGRSHV
jgi:3-oxoadipate enol-lactonase